MIEYIKKLVCKRFGHNFAPAEFECGSIFRTCKRCLQMEEVVPYDELVERGFIVSELYPVPDHIQKHINQILSERGYNE